MEEIKKFKCDEFDLESLIYKGGSEKGIVITHPHPLYGGNMKNMVVETIAGVFQKKLFTTLRFNFRGVGESQGSYSGGAGEVRDVCCAIKLMRKMGIQKIYLAGYSFGAWVNARLSSMNCEKGLFTKMVMVSPPVAFIDFGDIAFIDSLELVITGSQDDLAPPSQIQEMLSHWNSSAKLEIIKGADHFYSNFLEQLAWVLSTAID
jgi:hypothetical protein